MSKKKHRKNKRSTIDWNTLVTSAIIDLIIGTILLIIDKLFS